jgi:hypothetical protein
MGITTVVLFAARYRNRPPQYHFQKGPGDHSFSCPVVTRDSFQGARSGGTWSVYLVPETWPLHYLHAAFTNCCWRIGVTVFVLSGQLSPYSKGKILVSYLPRPDRLWGSPNLLNGSGRLYHWRVRWPGQETHHSAPSSTEINNSWNYNSTPPYDFMSWCLIKKGDSAFKFILHTSDARGWRRAAWVLTELSNDNK